MSPERRLQIERLCESALQLAPSKRAAFLNEACEGDSELRREVESLLAGEERARTFLEDAPAGLDSNLFGQREPEPGVSALPSHILHYEVLEKLGEGGMGVVYKARDTRLDRFVALKILRAGEVADADRNRRFIREAKSASALNHPNIVTVHDLGSQGGVDFLVMEYVEGRTLAELVGGEGLPLNRLVEYAIQIADALAAAHAAGIVHRDLKPGNVMVTNEGRAKILDFGLAKTTYRTAPGEIGSTRTASEPQTREGTIVGTPAYMAPEQFRGQLADARSDIWALGVVLYEMAVGARPFQGVTAFEVVTAILAQPTPPLPGRLPNPLRKLIGRCLEKEPGKRYQQAAELRVALQGVRAITMPSGAASRRMGWRWPVLAAALALVMAIALAIVLAPWRSWVGPRSSTAAPVIDSLAVMPFATASGGPDTEYLGRGISEGLITRMSRVPGLKVISRDTAFRYKGQDKSIQTVGRELGVRAVLEGRVRQRGDSLSISTELVDTRDGELLWRSAYDGKAADILTIEQEISKEASRRLRGSMTGEQQQRVAASSTHNAEAYRLYLQGRYYWNQRQKQSLEKSAGYFRQAIDKDPGFALAWAGLADSFLMLGGWSHMRPAEAYPRARAAAVRAIQMDATLAEPHATLGYLKTLYEWDWPGSEQEFRRAIDLNPGYATAHHWYAYYFLTVGSVGQALAEVERARDEEPLSPIINWEVAYFYTFARQYDQAMVEARKAVELDPAFQPPVSLGRVYALQGRRGEAEAQLEHELRRPQRGPVDLGSAAATLTLLGRREEARKILRQLHDLEGTQYIQPALLAIIYGSLGENDKAFEYFDRALQDRSLIASWLRDPVLDPLRPDPRWAKMFQRLALKP